MKKHNFGRSVMNASIGIAHALSKERNISIQTIIGIIVVIISLILNIPKTSLMIIIIVSFIVIILELVNTAIEHLIDKLSPNFDKDYGRVKDIMAGAVLLSVIMAIIVGIMILLNPLLFALFRIM